MEEQKLQSIIEAVLFAAPDPLTVPQILDVFPLEERPEPKHVREILKKITEDYANRPLELKEVASGFRFQIRADYAVWIAPLWQERPLRYSRALLETLAILAYRQPVSRADIENIRGVAVSSSILKTLMEREWVHIVGHKDLPGKPAIYGTTKKFLDYFNLKSLSELPSLADMQDLEELTEKLDKTIQLELEGMMVEESLSENLEKIELPMDTETEISVDQKFLHDTQEEIDEELLLEEVET